MAAAEEVERGGARQIELDHLFIALVGSASPAGDVLREAGITIEAARRAVISEHDDQLTRVGVHDVSWQGSRTVPKEGPREVQWNEQARQLFARASGDASGLPLLMALLEEPSGFVASAVRRLDVEPEALLTAARRVQAGPPRQELVPRSLTVVFFVAAPPESVWGLADDPRRRPEWDSSIASVEEAADGQTWIAAYRPAAVLRGDPTRWACRLRVTERDKPKLHEWRISWPAHTGRPRAVHRLRLTLEPKDGGTMATLSLLREQAEGRRRLPSLSRSAVGRALAWLQLSRTASSLARASQQLDGSERPVL